MIWSKQILVCVFLIYNITTFCLALAESKCTPTNSLSIQSDIDNIKKIVEPFALTEFIPSPLPDLTKSTEEYQEGTKDEDVNLNIIQLVTKYQYPVEQHQVNTRDGYILDVFRIPSDGQVVFLMHGVACSSDDFVTPGPNALAFELADEGYDVWLGNNRGNVHSRHHQSISPDCAEFWDFSFHEIGIYDIPAMIDYILSTTNQTKLSYVGHSQGSTDFFVMCSEKPEYNDKISVMIPFSAVVFMGKVRSPAIRIFSPLTSLGDLLTNVLGIHEVAPRDPFINAFTSAFCGTPESAIICDTAIFAGAGFNYPQIDAKRLPVIFAHYPAGFAIKQGFHYGYNSASGKFAQYDYGLLNMKKYGTSEPPEYPLEKVTCPVAMFYSVNDWLTSASDTYKLLARLPNVVEFYHVPDSMFNHFDYLFAKDADKLVNEEVKRVIAKYAV